MSIVNDMLEIISAVFANDAWMMSEAFQGPAAWVLGALITILGGLFFLLRVQALSSPTADYDLSDPTIVAITRGTVGSVGDIRLGLRFVDRESAGISVFYEDSDEEAIDLILELGEVREVNGESIRLVDLLPGRDTAVFQVNNNR